MKNISTYDLHTERLDLRVPKMEEQYRLWEILIDEEVNRYYFPTPDRIFRKNNLDKEKIEDLKTARKIFIKQLSDWERQQMFYEQKIEKIKEQDNSQKFTWSVFLKNTDIVIGQVTCQPKDDEPENIRDVGWFIAPNYSGNGYATEAANAMLDFMFNEVEITDIYTSAAEINPASWKIMEKLGFEFIGRHKSTYFKGDEILISKNYHLNKKFFLENNILNK